MVIALRSYKVVSLPTGDSMPGEGGSGRSKRQKVPVIVARDDIGMVAVAPRCPAVRWLEKTPQPELARVAWASMLIGGISRLHRRPARQTRSGGA